MQRLKKYFVLNKLVLSIFMFSSLVYFLFLVFVFSKNNDGIEMIVYIGIYVSTVPGILVYITLQTRGVLTKINNQLDYRDIFIYYLLPILFVILFSLIYSIFSGQNISKTGEILLMNLLSIPALIMASILYLHQKVFNLPISINIIIIILIYIVYFVLLLLMDLILLPESNIAFYYIGYYVLFFLVPVGYLILLCYKNFKK